MQISSDLKSLKLLEFLGEEEWRGKNPLQFCDILKLVGILSYTNNLQFKRVEFLGIELRQFKCPEVLSTLNVKVLRQEVILEA